MSEINYLSMSDEDLLKLDEEALMSPSEGSEESTEEEVAEIPDDGSEQPTESPTTEAEEEGEQTTTVQATDEKQPTEESHQDVSTKDVKEVSEQETTIDYKAAYERVLAPFKANGKTVQVDSIEDAVSLMQMGANYNKRMQELKPNLRIVKMLGDNGLLDETKLNMLIEVAQGKPEAIKKLVADSQLDAYSLDAEQDAKYVPNDYRVNDSQIELDDVIKELQESPVFSRTADIVGNKWDAPSRAEVAANPKILRVINDHIATGFYETVTNEIEKQRMLGRLPTGVTDVQLYGLTAKYLTEMQQSQQSAAPSEVTPSPKEQQRQAKKPRLYY